MQRREGLPDNTVEVRHSNPSSLRLPRPTALPGDSIGLPRCNVCHYRLPLDAVWNCLRHRHRMSYPFRTIAGERPEQIVRWLCQRCWGRADRLRQAWRKWWR
jgi:hypothetical protein